jgi:hypothetical protein
VSPELRRWFGDSVVVGPDGEPLVVYHGTTAGRAIGRFRVPAYFSNDARFAEAFAARSTGDGGVSRQSGHATYPVYLRIERPYRLDGYVDGSHFMWDKEDVARMRAEGYDGVIIDRAGEDIYAVFDQNQVKSATGNRGSYGPGPDIREARLTEATGYTVTELVANTDRVLGSAIYKADAGNYRFEHINLNVSKRFRSATYDCVTFSRESGKHYNSTIIFYNVDPDKGELPDLDSSPVRVSCSCPSYYFYCSYWNKVLGAHARRPLRPYVRKTDDLPERNALHVACICKHLIAFSNFLEEDDYQLGNITPPAPAYRPFNADPEQAARAYGKPDNAGASPAAAAADADTGTTEDGA